MLINSVITQLIKSKKKLTVEIKKISKTRNLKQNIKIDELKNVTLSELIKIENV